MGEAASEGDGGATGGASQINSSHQVASLAGVGDTIDNFGEVCSLFVAPRPGLADLTRCFGRGDGDAVAAGSFGDVHRRVGPGEDHRYVD
jgi:hypothetical protein